MTIFKAGDRVRYERFDQPNHKWNGSIGTVLSVTNDIYVNWDEGSLICYEEPTCHYIGKPAWSHFAFNIQPHELKYDPLQQGYKDEDI